MLKNTKLRAVFDYVVMLSGAVLYALAVSIFFVKSDMMTGGLTGIAIIINKLFGLPTGVVVFTLNIPLFIVGLKVLGLRFLRRTLITTATCSLFLDIFGSLPAFTEDRLLAAVFGGLMTGAGLALVFLKGGTTGGSDIVASLVSRIKPHLAMGRIILIFDVAVVTAGTLIFRQTDIALYSAIALYIGSITIDALLYGSDAARICYIVSGRHEEIASEVLLKMGRGVTVLHGVGAYTKSPQEVLFCVVKRPEIGMLKRIAHDIDPGAFVVLGDAREVIGDGFKRIEPPKDKQK